MKEGWEKMEEERRKRGRRWRVREKGERRERWEKKRETEEGKGNRGGCRGEG